MKFEKKNQNLENKNFVPDSQLPHHSPHPLIAIHKDVNL